MLALMGASLIAVAFAGALAACVLFFADKFLRRRHSRLRVVARAFLTAAHAALAVACGLLVFCFMSGDVSILYVLEQRSLSNDPLAWLYRLSGLWAGRAGSLLFWAYLMSLFSVLIVARRKGSGSQASRNLDDIACAVMALVIAVFCGLLLFSEGNMPFEPTPDRYFDENRMLNAAGSLNSMNQLLEHWAMAIHPPLLFAGYAGIIVPFAYAMASLVEGDPSSLWVERSTRFALASWLFLGAGIGLGAVWAYTVLGWGGYWGWDPVENASLLPWLACTALIHSFTVCRQRDAYKRWALACACLAFAFVMTATFITRSGMVESVHAFAGDPVSLALFGGLIIVSSVASALGIVLRWRMLAPANGGADDVEYMLSKEGAYYFNNVVLVIFALLLAYMTVTSALPEWMPFGGRSLGAVAYEAVARPLGVAYLFILAVCPLLSWGKTSRTAFWRRVRVPAFGAVAVFGLLVVYWAVNLRPAYEAMVQRQDASSVALLEAGPSWYYHGIAIAGFFVASLLLFSAGVLLLRNLRSSRKRGAAIGGSFAHLAMAVMLVGLIGSDMYATEVSGYMTAGEDGNVADTFVVRDYELAYAGDSVVDGTDEDGTVTYRVDFDVYRDGQLVGQAHPSVQLDVMTQQQKLNAAVLRFADEDLFVVYRGVNAQGSYSLDVHVNPLVSLVWVGFAMLMIGTLCALVMPRGKGAE